MSPVSAPGQARPVTPSTILAATLSGLVERLTADDAVDPAMLAELAHARDLAAGLDPYLDRCTTPESPALAELARRTAAEDWNGPSGNGVVEQEMLSGHVEGRFLQMIVTTARARRVLDIGMFTGYSALAMAEALPVDGRVVALEIDPRVAAFASACLTDLAGGEKIEVRVGPAQETLQALSATGDEFDVVFLDADKAGYVDHLTAVLDGGLLAEGGIVVVDNTLMQGQPWAAGTPTANGAAIARFNTWVADRPDLDQVLVPLRDGLTLIRRSGGR